MAIYIQLRKLFNDNELKNRIEVAIIIAAEDIRTEDSETLNHANRLVWARAAFNSPKTFSGSMLRRLLAENSEETVEVIQSVSDENLQILVDDAVDIFAGGS